MLCLFNGEFVDVIREQGYRDLLTFRSSSPEALKQFEGHSMSTILQVPHHIYTHILHVSEESIRIEHPQLNFGAIELFQRLTPAPVAYAYEFALDHGEGEIEGCYWFCWAEEVSQTRDNLLNAENELAGDPRFYPLFHIPPELAGAPLKFSFAKDEGDEEEDDEEDDDYDDV